MQLPFEKIDAEVHEQRARHGDRDQARLEPAHLYRRRQQARSCAHVPGRDGPFASTRRRSASSRSSTSSSTRGGTRRPARPGPTDAKPIPPGPGQSARDALDGALGAVRRHPRHPRRRLDRLLGLARLHPDADPAGRVAVHPGRRGHAGVHRRGMTGRAKTVGQGIAIAARRRPARAPRLEARVRTTGRARRAAREGRAPRRARVHAEPARRAGRHALARAT